MQLGEYDLLYSIVEGLLSALCLPKPDRFTSSKASISDVQAELTWVQGHLNSSLIFIIVGHILFASTNPLSKVLLANKLHFFGSNHEEQVHIGFVVDYWDETHEKLLVHNLSPPSAPETFFAVESSLVSSVLLDDSPQVTGIGLIERQVVNSLSVLLVVLKDVSDVDVTFLLDLFV